VEATRKTIKERAEHLQLMEKNIRNPAVRTQLDEVKTIRAQYLPLGAAYLELIEQQKFTEAKPFLLEKMRPVQVAYVTELEKRVEVQRKVPSEQGQSLASNQIARHVENIAQMAQENSAAVDQTKATAKSLQDLSASLQTSAMRFTV
jgi:methyl-accepting chemotaxis protein